MRDIRSSLLILVCFFSFRHAILVTPVFDDAADAARVDAKMQADDIIVFVFPPPFCQRDARVFH